MSWLHCVSVCLSYYYTILCSYFIVCYIFQTKVGVASTRISIRVDDIKRWGQTTNRITTIKVKIRMLVWYCMYFTYFSYRFNIVTLPWPLLFFFLFLPSWIPSTFSFSACKVVVNSLSVVALVLSPWVATLARAARILFISAGSSSWLLLVSCVSCAWSCIILKPALYPSFPDAVCMSRMSRWFLVKYVWRKPQVYSGSVLFSQSLHASGYRTVLRIRRYDRLITCFGSYGWFPASTNSTAIFIWWNKTSIGWEGS